MAGGDYGRIRHTFWTDPDIKRVLDPEQKALLLYWFTSPHSNLIGLYHCPLEYVALETGLPLEKVEAWTFGVLAKFVTYDPHTEEVLVHRAGKHQVAEELKEADRRVKAVLKVLQETHSEQLIARFRELYPHWPLGLEAPAPLDPDPTPTSDEEEDAGSDPTDVDDQAAGVDKTPSEGAPKPLPSPSEANAVAVAVQCSAIALHPPGVAHAREAPTTDPVDLEPAAEVPTLEPDDPGLPLVPGDTGARVVPLRPAGLRELDAPFATMDWAGRISGKHLMTEWINLQPVPPSRSDRDRFGTACRLIADEHTTGEIALAFVGMRYTWPWGDPKTGEPRESWTPNDLRNDFTKALANAARHPAIRSVREDQQLDDALDAALNRRTA